MSGRRKRLDLATPGLLGLPLTWLVVFFIVPIGIVGAYSLDVFSIYPGKHPVTWSGWDDFFHSAIYLKLFWKSVRLSLLVSVIVVVLAYPVAYFLALSGTKRKYVLLLILIAPFLTSYLLRVLAWKVILGSNGVLNRRLLEAATDLGATRWQAFLRVTLPLSAPGVIAAFLFVFIPTVGEFVTPSLVGGTSGYMYGNQISDLFSTGFPDWRTGSVLALFLLAVVAVLTGAFSRFLGMRQTTS